MGKRREQRRTEIKTQISDFKAHLLTHAPDDEFWTQKFNISAMKGRRPSRDWELAVMEYACGRKSRRRPGPFSWLFPCHCAGPRARLGDRRICAERFPWRVAAPLWPSRREAKSDRQLTHVRRLRPRQLRAKQE